jgi:hypothetical protein
VSTVVASSGNANDVITADAGSPAEAPGFYRFAPSEFHITALCDGMFFCPLKALRQMSNRKIGSRISTPAIFAPDVVRLQPNPLLIDT